MLKKMRIFATGVVSALISCIVLVGCGTKGPLYIPEQRYPQKESSQKAPSQKEHSEKETLQNPTPQDEPIKTAP